MVKISSGRVTAVLFFALLIVGAGFCLQRLSEDISQGKYFSNQDELRYELTFLASYLLIIGLLLRYGYYLAVNRVNWAIVRDDFFYLLNKRYFGKFQWGLNILLFWLSLIGFVLSLAISAMRGFL